MMAVVSTNPIWIPGMPQQTRFAVRNSIRLLRAAFVTTLLLLTELAVAEDWPHWRGSARTDIVRERSGWNGQRWLSSDEPLWVADVGQGATSPIVVKNRVFTLGWTDDKDRVVCLDLDTGREVWSESYPAPLHARHANGDEGLYDGPTSTPAYDPATGQLFALSVDGDLKAWTAATGKLAWSLNLYDQYEVPQRPRIGRSGQRDYGYTSSPLVYRDWLLVEVGATDGTLMAFSKLDGKQVWKSAYQDSAGHSGSPVPITVEGIACVAVLTLRQLVVIRVDRDHEGETLATYPWETEFANNIPTPTVHENEILITTKYNHEAMCKLRITRQGAVKIWEQPYASGVCSPVIHRNKIYWSTQQATCLDFRTGELLWQHGKFGDAGSCVVTQDDKLIIWADRGTLALFDIAGEPQRHRELARLQFDSPADVWPHVVLANGRLICKDRTGHIVCLKVN